MCWNSPEGRKKSETNLQKKCVHMKWKFLLTRARNAEREWKRKIELPRVYVLCSYALQIKIVCSLSCLNNIKCISFQFASHYFMYSFTVTFIIHLGQRFSVFPYFWRLIKRHFLSITPKKLQKFSSRKHFNQTK